MFHLLLSVICIVVLLAGAAAICGLASLVVYVACFSIVEHRRKSKDRSARDAQAARLRAELIEIGLRIQKAARERVTPKVEPEEPADEPVDDDSDTTMPFDGCFCLKCEQARSNIDLAAVVTE